MFFLPLWIMSSESPCQALFLGFDSNDGSRTQVARQVDLELQSSVENSVVFAKHSSQASQEGLGPRKSCRVTWSRSLRISAGPSMDS